jgi:hypothetical protein
MKAANVFLDAPERRSEMNAGVFRLSRTLAQRAVALRRNYHTLQAEGIGPFMIGCILVFFSLFLLLIYFCQVFIQVYHYGNRSKRSVAADVHTFYPTETWIFDIRSYLHL